MTRYLVALIVAAPFWLTAAWCAATTSYRHVRVIPPPVDWETLGWA